MQDLIKRYFWVLGGVVVMVCAVFAAKATSHIVEAKFLGDSDHGPKVAAIVLRPETPIVAARTKDGGQLASRNMFCSDCTPSVEVKTADPSSVAMTTLPLGLLATNIGSRPEESYATIINTDNQKQGAYALGDR